MKKKNRCLWLLFGVSYCIALANVAAAAPALRALDFHPFDVSADGSVVIGFDSRTSADRVWKAIVWHSATGVRQEIDLIPSFPERVGDPDASAAYQTGASSISANGSVVVGDASPLFKESFYPTEAFRWTATTGTVSLGTTVGGEEMWSAATGVSGDGSVVVGNAQDGSYVAFRWTADTGMIPLPDMHFASAVSDDARTVVGGSQWLRPEAVRWTAEEGTIRLGVLPGDNRSTATDVSADGSVVVGVSGGDFVYIDEHVFRWTEAGGMADLGRISTYGAHPYVATSADGSIIIGNWIVQTAVEPFIWDEVHGMRPLHDVLVGLGVNVGGWDLESVTGISGDGRTLIGSGLDPSGNRSDWIVTVPEPAGLMLLIVATVALFSRRRRGRLGRSTIGEARSLQHLGISRNDRTPLTILILVLGLVTPAMSLAQPGSGLPAASFHSLGLRRLAFAVSDDGTTVVGRSEDIRGLEPHVAFRWTASGGFSRLEPPPGGRFSEATAVSADGSVIVGWDGGYDPPHHPIRWTASGDAVTLDRPGRPSDVSADGSIIIGHDVEFGGPSFRWTAAQGMVSVPGFAGAISADGSVIVGARFSSGGFGAFRWTEATGMLGLGDLPPGFRSSGAAAVSADGSVVVGSGSYGSRAEQAFRWTESTGIVGLGELGGGIVNSWAVAVSADGSVIVGNARDDGCCNQQIFIWDAEHGMRSLQTVLAREYDLDLSGWRLNNVSDISADGSVIVGLALDEGGRTAGFVVTLPEPAGCVLALASSALFGRRWRACRRPALSE